MTPDEIIRKLRKRIPPTRVRFSDKEVDDFIKECKEDFQKSLEIVKK